MILPLSHFSNPYLEGSGILFILVDPFFNSGLWWCRSGDICPIRGLIPLLRRIDELMVWNTIQTNHSVINFVHVRWEHLINTEMIVVEFRCHIFCILSSWISKSVIHWSNISSFSNQGVQIVCSSLCFCTRLQWGGSHGLLLSSVFYAFWIGPALLIPSPFVGLQSMAHGGELVRPLPP